MSFETKLQTVGGSLSTSVPSTIRDALNLKKGEIIKWEIDFNNNPPTVTLKKS